MPVQSYRPLKNPCKLCGEGFDYHQEASTPALNQCPTCGQPVEKKTFNTVTLPKLLRPLSVSQAKQTGFTVLKRTDSDSFEKQ